MHIILITLFLLLAGAFAVDPLSGLASMLLYCWAPVAAAAFRNCSDGHPALFGALWSRVQFTAGSLVVTAGAGAHLVLLAQAHPVLATMLVPVLLLGILLSGAMLLAPPLPELLDDFNAPAMLRSPQAALLLRLALYCAGAVGALAAFDAVPQVVALADHVDGANVSGASGILVLGYCAIAVWLAIAGSNVKEPQMFRRVQSRVPVAAVLASAVAGVFALMSDVAQSHAVLASVLMPAVLVASLLSLCVLALPPMPTAMKTFDGMTQPWKLGTVLLTGGFAGLSARGVLWTVESLARLS